MSQCVHKRFFRQTYLPQKKTEKNNSHKIHVLYNFATIYHSNILTFILLTPIDHNLLTKTIIRRKNIRRRKEKKKKSLPQTQNKLLVLLAMLVTFCKSAAWATQHQLLQVVMLENTDIQNTKELSKCMPHRTPSYSRLFERWTEQNTGFTALPKFLIKFNSPYFHIFVRPVGAVTSELQALLCVIMCHKKHYIDCLTKSHCDVVAAKRDTKHSKCEQFQDILS